MLLRIADRFELRAHLQKWGTREIVLYKRAAVPNQHASMLDEVFYLGFMPPLTLLERRLTSLLHRITPTFILKRLGHVPAPYVADLDSAMDWVEENRGKLGSLG